VTQGDPEDLGVVVEAGIGNTREPADVRRHHRDEETTLSVTRAELINAKNTTAGLDPENAPQLAQVDETMTVTRRARAAIEDAHGAEKRERLTQGLDLEINPGDVLVLLRYRVGGQQAQRVDDEDEKRGNVRRKRRKNGRRQR